MTKIILIINDERGLKYFNCKEEFLLKTSKLRSSNSLTTWALSGRAPSPEIKDGRMGVFVFARFSFQEGDKISVASLKPLW